VVVPWSPRLGRGVGTRRGIRGTDDLLQKLKAYKKSMSTKLLPVKRRRGEGDLREEGTFRD